MRPAVAASGRSVPTSVYSPRAAQRRQRATDVCHWDDETDAHPQQLLTGHIGMAFTPSNQRRFSRASPITQW
jgi:hypothetical protein